MKVYKNKYGQWETLFKNKLMNGETIFYNQKIRFPKGKEPTKDKINIRFDSDTFFGSVFHFDKTDENHPVWVIMDWTEEEPKMLMKPDGEMVKQCDFSINPSLEIKDDDLPFY